MVLAGDGIIQTLSALARGYRAGCDVGGAGSEEAVKKRGWKMSEFMTDTPTANRSHMVSSPSAPINRTQKIDTQRKNYIILGSMCAKFLF